LPLSPQTVALVSRDPRTAAAGGSERGLSRHPFAKLKSWCPSASFRLFPWPPILIRPRSWHWWRLEWSRGRAQLTFYTFCGCDKNTHPDIVFAARYLLVYEAQHRQNYDV